MIKKEKKLLKLPGSAGGVAFSDSCGCFDNTYLGRSSPAIISFWVKRRSGDVACIDNRAICDRAMDDTVQVAILFIEYFPFAIKCNSIDLNNNNDCDVSQQNSANNH